MEQALTKIGEQGLAGALLVLFALAIVYLNKKREDTAEERLKESKEALLTIAAANTIMVSLKEAVSGLSTTLAALNSTVQTMHSENKAALDQARERDVRVERMIEATAKTTRDLESTLDKLSGQVSSIAGRETVGR